MDIQTIINDKQLKAKAKTEAIGQLLLNGKLDMSELINVAQAAKDPDKATCIEALEFATKAQPALATPACLDFVATALTEKAPRVKWESAKVIGHIAHLYPTRLDTAIKHLLINTEHTGTVVRWSAAFALGEIMQLKTKHNKTLVPALEAICLREEQNSVKKMYLAALKKIAQ
jgi:HEAT repeat protein